MPTRPSTIVVGASSGIGKAAAMLLAQAGYDLLLVARNAQRLAQSAQEVSAQAPGQGNVRILAADVMQAQAAGRIVTAALEAFARIDALANVAGYAPVSTIDQITSQEWRKVVDSNLSYAMHLAAAAWATFRQQKSGLIVNVSSMASFDPFDGFAMYAAAKAGLNMFTRVAAAQGRAIGVKAVCIAPGAVETPMLRAIFDEKAVPHQRTLDPMDVAAVIRDCITGQRPFTSGETILLPSP